MFDRLVGGAVLADADAVVGEDPDRTAAASAPPGACAGRM